MYITRILAGGISTVQQLLTLSEADIPRLTGADSYHVKRVSHAIQWVRAKLESPSQGGSATTSGNGTASSGGGVGGGSAGGGGNSTTNKQNSSNVKDKV